MASPATPQTTIEPRRVPRAVRLDPSRHAVPDEVPDGMLVRWQGMLDDAEARHRATREKSEALVAAQRGYATELRVILTDASMMHHDLIALAYLFQKALIEDADEDSDLLKASHLVVDVMRTIAARLAAADERAALAYTKAGL